jgi:N-acetylglucosaminyldiphosphoundecaprenol N-acetyl-beta-D-mannosaminyltransferase
MPTLHSTFGVLGVPVDAFAIDQVIDVIDEAVRTRKKLLISTINSNFLVNSAISQRFRLSLLRSHVCTVDGIGMLLMCRLASIGGISRVSGADMMELLLHREHNRIGRPLRVFFFGGNEAVADRARHIINKAPSSAICCVGSLNPGFGSMEDLSSPEFIKIINDANPDFLIVSLGAERGQEWLLRNRDVLNVPVSAHLGAAVNFVAGSIARAPRRWQMLGFEWLWRIRQEPVLAKRYYRDGLILMRIVVKDALPQALGQFRDRMLLALRPQPLRIEIERGEAMTTIRMSGAAVGNMDDVEAIFAQVLNEDRQVTLDCRELSTIDPAGVGKIMRFERELSERGLELTIRQAQRRIGRRLDLVRVATS